VQGASGCPGLHGEEVIEDLTPGMVLLVHLRATNVEVHLDGGGIDGAGPRGPGAIRAHHQGLPVLHPLRHHEVDLLIGAEGFAVEGGVPPPPPGHEEDALWPVGKVSR
jgi:hypothetical protein